MVNIKKIAVIGGGYSSEREISIKSASNVYEALKRLGYNAEYIDLTAPPDDSFIDNLKNYELILPILHGLGGEDGHLQSLLEKENINFFGSGSEASKTAFDKLLTKKLLMRAGVKTPTGELLDKNNIQDFINLNKEFVLKPINEGSSVGVYIVRDGKKDLNQINKLIENYRRMIGEELIKGIEITVPVLGEKALPPVAIIPPENEEFDLSNKYNGKTKELCPIPTNLLSQEIQNEAMQIAQKTHETIGARHISRIDMIVSNNNEVVVLEINTIPGLTSESLYPKSAKSIGIDFDELVDAFVKMSKPSLQP